MPKRKQRKKGNWPKKRRNWKKPREFWKKKRRKLRQHGRKRGAALAAQAGVVATVCFARYPNLILEDFFLPFGRKRIKLDINLVTH